MTYEVDWTAEVLAAAPRVFALVVGPGEAGVGVDRSGSVRPGPHTIAWGLQFPTQAIVYFEDAGPGHPSVAVFASAERALARLGHVLDLSLIWTTTPGTD